MEKGKRELYAEIFFKIKAIREEIIIIIIKQQWLLPLEADILQWIMKT